MTEVVAAPARKRGNSKPNVKRRGDTYTYYLYVTDHLGNRKQHTKGGYKTQREAEDARVAALASIQTGSYVKAERQTVAEFFNDEWLPSRKPPVLEESTWHSYDRYVRLHVLPWIGVIPLQQLSPVDLNKLYRRLLESDRKRPGVPQRHPEALHQRATALRAENLTHETIAATLREEFPIEAAGMTRFAVSALLRRGAPKSYANETQPGLAPRTVRYIHTIIHAALKDALRWSRVVRNVADAATPPSTTSAKSPKVKAWTAEQLKAFLQFAAENRYLPAWIFLATSGCRRGEALGLRWADIDLNVAVASIGHQVTSIDHRVIIKELPKTKRGHVIRLDAGTVAMLRTHRATQNEERLLVGEGFKSQDLVFCRPDGSPYHPERFSLEFRRNQEYFNRDHTDDLLPELTLHGLRHTWATLALRAGIDIKIVSERLNHSSTNITREIYTHVTPPMQSDAAERVAALLRS